MKLAIMQPYLFPYLGYFQLIQAVDKFVFYDDVTYIKGGWINRNRFLYRGEVRYFTVPTENASSFVPISAVGIQARLPWRSKLIETIRIAYKEAPYLQQGLALFRRVIDAPTRNIGDMARASVEYTLEYVGLKREVVPSSSIYGNAQLKGSERVRDICLREGATEYVNAPGGRSLYRADEFARQGCRLRFLVPEFPEYRQGRGEFVAGLSVLDMLMRCPPEQIAGMLNAHSLEPETCGCDKPVPESA